MWKRKNTETIFKHPRITLVEDDVLLPSGEETKYLRFDNEKDVVTVIAEKSGKYLVLKEYTYPIDRNVNQFVEGFIESSEDWEAAAVRELKEEAGLRPQKLEKIGQILKQHRRTDAVHKIVLATELVEVAAEPESTEQISTHWYSREELSEMIAVGEIIQKNTLAAWAVYCATRP